MYFKWKAYDFNVKYFEGVIECSRFEEAVIKLAERQLIVKELSSIEYDEYKALQKRERIIQKMENIKTRIQNKSQNPNRPKYQIKTLKISKNILKIIIVIFSLGLIIFLAYAASNQ